MSCAYEKAATAVPPGRGALLLAVNNLPAGPRLLAQLPRLLSNLDTTIEEIVALMRHDAALTARMIRIANSALFSGGQPLYSIEEAVLRLGFSEVYRITGFTVLAQLSNQQIPLYDITGTQFRENSLLTALISETLAPLAGVDCRVAYTAGLLRSAGKIALDRAVRGDSNCRAATYASGPLADWEMQTFSCTSSTAGAIVLEAWNFPAPMIEAVRDHCGCGPEAPALTRLLHVAAGAAERCGHGLPGEYSYWELEGTTAGALAGIDEPQLNDGICRALETFGPLRAALA